MESARLVTQPPAECTVNATNTGKGKLATSHTVGTTAGAPTTATATSLGRSCASATTVGKVRGNCTNQYNGKKPGVFIDTSNIRIEYVCLSHNGEIAVFQQQHT